LIEPWKNISLKNMKYKKESLDKLLQLINQICQDDENTWFREQLVELLLKPPLMFSELEKDGFGSFFKLLKKQFKIKATYLYRNIPEKKLKSELIIDCTKMYWFQVNNDIQGMFIQAFYQMENMLNYYLINSNAFDKIIKSPSHYEYHYSDKFSVICKHGFFSSDKFVPIEKVTIWSKIVYWSVESENSDFLKNQHRNFSNLVNVRNDYIHKNSITPKKSEFVVSKFTFDDYSAFGFVINILKQIVGTLIDIDRLSVTKQTIPTFESLSSEGQDKKITILKKTF
jgi:hypothetical protein